MAIVSETVSVNVFLLIIIREIYQEPCMSAVYYVRVPGQLSIRPPTYSTLVSRAYFLTSLFNSILGFSADVNL